MRSHLFAIVAVLFTPLVSFAQPLSDRVPDNALIYIGWQGSSAMPAAYEKSHAKGMLDSTNLPQMFNDLIPRVIQRIGMEDKQVEEKLKIITSIAAPLWRHPSAFYFAGVEFAPGRPPTPRMALLCDAGDEAAALLDQVNKILGTMLEAPFPIKAFSEGNLVVLAIGFEQEKAAIAAKDAGPKALSLSAAFKDAIGQVNKEPVAIVYVDIEGLLGLADRGIEAHAPPEAQQMWPRIKDAAGLGGVRRFIWTGAFEGADWASQCFVAAPAPRVGVATLFNASPMSNEMLKAIPATVTWAAVGHFDIAAFVSEARESAGKIDLGLQRMFDMGLGAAQMALAMNVQKEFLETIGSEWGCYLDPASSGNGFLGLTVINRLAKPADAQKAFEKVEMFADNMINAQLAQQRMAVNFQQIQIGGVMVHSVATPFVSPSWAIVDGNLYCALYPQVVAAAVENAKAKSILENEQFVAARKRMNADKASGMVYSDLPRTSADTYQLLLAASQTATGFAELFNIKAPQMVIPTYAKFKEHLTPVIGFSWTDDAGWHAKEVGPFPGAQFLSNPLALAAPAAMAAGVVMPMRFAKVAEQRQQAVERQRQLAPAQPKRPAPPQQKQEQQPQRIIP
jgi:hypothetical protein